MMNLNKTLLLLLLVLATASMNLSLARLLSGDHGEEEDHPNSWCHCHGTDIHCSEDKVLAESFCECHDHGGVIEVHCQEVDSSCHCDGTELHCSSESAEEQAAATCQCHDGTLECIGDEEHDEDHDDGNKPWAQVIVSSLLVNLVTLAGLFVVAGQWVTRIFCPNKMLSNEGASNWKFNIIPMFACGAVLATAFFLILPEALHLIQSAFVDGDHGHNHRLLREKNPESQATWRWGTSVLGGIMIPVVVHACFPHHHDDDTSHTHGMKGETTNETSSSLEAMSNIDSAIPVDREASEVSDDEEVVADDFLADEEVVADDFLPGHDTETPTFQEASSKKNGSTDPPEQAKVIVEEKKDLDHAHKMHPKSDNAFKRALMQANDKYNIALLLSLTVADFLHQLSDGVFLGTAWLLCDKDLAITVAIATVIHCFPHQLADYLMMVNHCGLSQWAALGINFLTGLGTLLGGVIVLAFLPSNKAIGVILAIGGGIFLHVAISECLGRAEQTQVTTKHKLQGFLAFIVGCVPIGLVLLNHEHCGGHDH